MDDFRVLFAMLVLIAQTSGASSVDEFINEMWTRSSDASKDVSNDVFDSASAINAERSMVSMGNDKVRPVKDIDTPMRPKKTMTEDEQEKQVIAVSDTHTKSHRKSNLSETRSVYPYAQNLSMDIVMSLYGDILQNPNKRNANRQHSVSEGQATCNRIQRLCWGMNHPQCVVKYPGPTSTVPSSRCRVIVQCNYTGDFLSNNGMCFAAKNAFPLPKLPSVNATILIYRYTIKLFARDAVLDLHTTQRTRIEAMQHVEQRINQFASGGLDRFYIITEYICAQMTPCA